MDAGALDVSLKHAGVHNGISRWDPALWVRISRSAGCCRGHSRTAPSTPLSTPRGESEWFAGATAASFAESERGGHGLC